MKILIVIIPFLFNCKEVNYTKKQTVQVEQTLNNTTNNAYSWKSTYSIENKLINRIAVPKGFVRTSVSKNSFEDWLRNLPLKEGNPKVKLYNGKFKNNQTAQYSVIDIDVGTKDLQQCADAVMRLRAEYLFSNELKEKIAFNFTSGDKCEYKSWSNGVRPKISGNSVSFNKTKEADYSYKNFMSYMQTIFTYCGTYSLDKELKIKKIEHLKAGDVFIKGGFPGHAVIVVDVAINTVSKEKIFLLAQSYMPAQDIHILKNPIDDSLSPWFSVKFGETLQTPEWNFNKSTLKEF